ncbi:lipopolysaccharide biosynthesis protein [Luteolibacter soli]|uniref:Lipopolysaccharide biosynthesis protein n=1 Tax=Luteolibacter soli TaxID=3135280 RepID=A0ABU9B2M3_9BACT
MITLKQRAFSGFLWSFIDALGARLMQFVIGLTLARLLLPKEFGLIGMLTLFIMVSQAFVAGGFGSALIRKKDATDLDSSSIFYFNLALSALLTGLLCLAAPWVAGFFSEPLLVPLLRVLSLLIVINAFGLVQGTLMMKAMDFKTQAKITVIASAASGAIGISLALCGFGVWSLAYQQLAQAIFRVALLWIFNSWRPRWAFSFDSLRCLFAFGSKMLASELLNTIFENAYLLLIGRVFSAADLGFYTRANTLQEMPSKTLSMVVDRVAFPLFSSIQDDLPRVKQGMKKALAILGCLNFPIMVGLAVVAEPLVVTLLTDKWLPCVPYFQLLCVVGLLYPLHLVNLNVLKALGRSDLFLRLEIMKKVLVALNLAISWRWGISAMIAGQVIISIVSYFLNSHYSKALLGYSSIEQLGDMAPYLFTALLMGVGTYMLRLLEFHSMPLLLVVQVATGALLFTLIARLARLSAFLEAETTLKDKIGGLLRPRAG